MSTLIHEILPLDLFNDIFKLCYFGTDFKRSDTLFCWIRVCKAWKEFVYKHLEEPPCCNRYIEWHRQRNHTIVMKLPKLKKLELLIPIRDDTNFNMYLSTLGSIPAKLEFLNLKIEHYLEHRSALGGFLLMNILLVPRFNYLKSLRIWFTRITNKKNALYIQESNMLKHFFDDASFLHFQKLEELSFQIPYSVHLDAKSLPPKLQKLELFLTAENRFGDSPNVVLDLQSVSLTSLKIMGIGKSLHTVYELDLSLQTRLKNLDLELNYWTFSRYGFDKTVQQTNVHLPKILKLDTFTTKCIKFEPFDSLEVVDLTLRKFCNNQPYIWPKIHAINSLHLYRFAEDDLSQILNNLNLSGLRHLRISFVGYSLTLNHKLWKRISEIGLDTCQLDIDTSEAHCIETCIAVFNLSLSIRQVIVYLEKSKDTHISQLLELRLKETNNGKEKIKLLFDDS